MINFEFSRVAGDDGPAVLFTYRNTDLTGWALRMIADYRPGPNAKKKLSIDSTPVDLANGRVAFEFSPGDLVEGIADVEFELTPPGGGRFTVPSCNTVRMNVRKAVG